MIDANVIRSWIADCDRLMTENAEMLIELDSPIGDADHGRNMMRGFSEAAKKLTDTMSIDATLQSVAMTLISKVGGASGPLYGTLFLQAAKALKGRESLEDTDIELLLKTAVEAIEMRGKAKRQDKTMLDTLLPAYEAFAAARSDGKPLSTSLKEMAAAAEQGMQDTIPLVARKGRASYLGERSAGHQDPGATSSWLILKSFAETVEAAIDGGK